jgi:hypothetical protein
MSYGEDPLYVAVADIGRQSFPCGAAHCAVRLYYRARAEILSGRWKFPHAQAVNQSRSMSAYGPVTSFRRVAEFGRYRGNIGLLPAEHPEDLWVHGLAAGAESAQDGRKGADGGYEHSAKAVSTRPR